MKDKLKFFAVLFTMLFSMVLCGGVLSFEKSFKRLPEGASVRDGKLVIPVNRRALRMAQHGFSPVASGQNYVLSLKYASLSKVPVSLELRFFSGIDSNEKKFVAAIDGGMLTYTGGAATDYRLNFTVPEGADGCVLKFSAGVFDGKLEMSSLKLETGSEVVNIPKIDVAPELNGTLDQDFAARALCLTGFINTHTKDPQKDNTVVYLASTYNSVCGTVLMYFDPAAGVAARELERDERSVWRDDSIEIFISGIGGQMPMHQFVINTKGSVFDHVMASEAGDGDLRWNGNIRTAAGRIGNNIAVIQFELEMTNLGYNAITDTNIIDPLWKINFRRNHPANASRASHEQSTLCPLTSTLDINNYLTVRGMQEAAAASFRMSDFHNAIAVSENQAKTFWEVEKPLFKELISDVPTSFKLCSIWRHPIQLDEFGSFGRQYGIEYHREMMFDIYRQHRLNPVAMYDVPHFSAVIDYANESGNGIFWHTPYWIGAWTLLYNQDAYARYLDAVRKKLDENPHGISVVFFGDESLHRFVREMIPRANDPNYIVHDRKLAELIETIKRDYGYGKYTIPSRLDADEPFNFLAFRNYILDRFLEIQTDLREIVDAHNEKYGTRILLADMGPIGWGLLEKLNRIGKLSDVADTQSGPSQHPYRQSPAFSAKIYRDLIGVELKLCVHTESYLGRFSSEEVHAALSEAARGGAVAVGCFPADVRGMQGGGGGSYTHLDYFGHRPRWETYFNIVDEFHNMNALKFPEADFAILASDTTSLAASMFDLTALEMLFTVTNPGTGAWCKFISDTQLMDGDVDASAYPLILMTSARILDKEMADILKNYVSNGGLLICFDPEIFSYFADGSDASSVRRDLFGAEVSPISGRELTVKPASDPLFKGVENLALPVPQVKHALKAVDGGKVIAEYNDQTAAAVVKEYVGGGRAILFGFDTGSLSRSSNIPLWFDFFKGVQHNLGIKTGHDIWRFSFPKETIFPDKMPEFNGKCLTGNNAMWFRNVVCRPANIDIPEATYTLSMPSDGVEGTTFDFKKGNLTNRHFALSVPDITVGVNRPMVEDGRLKMSMFTDTFTSTDELTITFDFKQKVSIGSVRIFYGGTLPDFEITAGGKTFAGKGGQTPDTMVSQTECPVEASTLVIKIPARQAGEELVLSEIEIWDSSYKVTWQE